MAKDGKKKKMNNIISYDENHNIFNIHKGFAKDEKFKTNIDIGELVLDVSSKGRIRGIEIFNASEFFKEFDINVNKLKSLTDAEFNVQMKPSGIILSIVLKIKDLVIPTKIAVPLQNKK